MGKGNIKAQIWFTDFAIATIIFLFILISYYTYTTNISKKDSSAMDDLVSDAKTVSSSLISVGDPSGWNANNVVRIGFTDNYNRIDNGRFNEFMKINYNRTKKLLGTAYDYVLFFVNESNDVQNIEGFCVAGSSLVNITYDIAAAYYYEGPGEEEFLKNFMEGTFQADVYFSKNRGASPTEDFDAFRNNINNYDFVVVEHPVWSGSEFNQFETAAAPWLLARGTLFVGGELPAPQSAQAFGVQFKKIAGQSESDRLATVVNEDEYVDFNERDNVIFRQAYYIKDMSVGSDLIDIARFNGTYVEFDDIKANGEIALARWPYGQGKIFFFSDFDADYLAGDFQEILKGSAKKWANALCHPIDINGLERDNLVKTERMAIHNSDLLKMVLYLWQ